MTDRRRSLIRCSAWALLLVAHAASGGEPRFEDVSDTLGVNAGDDAHCSYCSTNGAALDAGVSGAVLDWDNDGLLDIFLTNSDRASKLILLRNAGGMTFEDVSAKAGLDLVDAALDGACAHPKASLVADLTGDGRTDLLILPGVQQSCENKGSLPPSPVLLVAQPDGSFADEAPVRLVAPQSGYFSAAAGDVDGDGDLDVAMLRASAAPIPSERRECVGTELFENVGGVLEWRQMSDIAGCGVVGAFTDVDEDGDLDYLQANDYGVYLSPNVLLRNDGLNESGGWKLSGDVAAAYGLATPVFGMGIAVSDLNRDGRRDYFVTSAGEDALLVGKAGGGFEDATDVWRAGSPMRLYPLPFKWGAVLFDADNDGDDDLAVAAASVGPEDEQSVFLRNDGGPPFVEATLASGLMTVGHSRVLIAADFDRDGRVDVLGAAFEQAYLFRNVTQGAGHWLEVAFEGSSITNKAGIGTTVVATCGGASWLHELEGGGSPGGTLAPELHFGLGSCTGPITLSVRWPSGCRQVVEGVAADQRLVVKEPQWLTVTPGAGGTSNVTLKFEGCGPTPATVAWSATAGTTTPAATLASKGAGVFEGVLTVPAAQSSATDSWSTLTFVADGKPLHAHPRIARPAVERVTWGLWPQLVSRVLPARVGVCAGTGGDLVALTATGGTVVGDVQTVPTRPGCAVAIVQPDPGAVDLILQARVNGKAYGEKLPVGLRARVDADASRFRVLPTVGGGLGPNVTGYKLSVLPMDSGGWFSPAGPSKPLEISVLRDGNPVALTFDSNPAGSMPGAYVAWATLAQLGGPGTLTANVEGVALTDRAVVSDSPISAKSVSPERSTFGFFGRHVHADGEDIVELFLVLADANGQSLPYLGPERISFSGDGLEPLPERTKPWGGLSLNVYKVYARVGSKQGTASITVLIDGVSTGLMRAVGAVAAAPYLPDPGRTEVAFVSSEGSTVDGALADGVSLTTVRVIPRDASGNLVGSGLGVTVAATGVAVSPVMYDGDGVYLASITSPASACTAALDVSVAGSTTSVALSFAGADGATANLPCSATTPPDAPDTGETCADTDDLPCAPTSTPECCAAVPNGGAAAAVLILFLVLAAHLGIRRARPRRGTSP